jgi:hypothetical protein
LDIYAIRLAISVLVAVLVTCIAPVAWYLIRRYRFRETPDLQPLTDADKRALGYYLFGSWQCIFIMMIVFVIAHSLES